MPGGLGGPRDSVASAAQMREEGLASGQLLRGPASVDSETIIRVGHCHLS